MQEFQEKRDQRVQGGDSGSLWASSADPAGAVPCAGRAFLHQLE